MRHELATVWHPFKYSSRSQLFNVHENRLHLKSPWKKCSSERTTVLWNPRQSYHAKNRSLYAATRRLQTLCELKKGQIWNQITKLQRHCHYWLFAWPENGFVCNVCNSSIYLICVSSENIRLVAFNFWRRKIQYRQIDFIGTLWLSEYRAFTKYKQSYFL